MKNYPACKDLIFGIKIYMSHDNCHNPLYSRTPKQVLLQTVKTQMKCSIMLHFIRVYTVFKDKKKIFRQKNTIFFSNYNLTPLDMYQVYCIKPKGRVHWYTIEYLAKSS